MEEAMERARVVRMVGVMVEREAAAVHLEFLVGGPFFFRGRAAEVLARLRL